jgi:hypothetical protein
VKPTLALGLGDVLAPVIVVDSGDHAYAHIGHRPAAERCSLSSVPTATVVVGGASLRDLVAEASVHIVGHSPGACWATRTPAKEPIALTAGRCQSGVSRLKPATPALFLNGGGAPRGTV